VKVYVVGGGFDGKSQFHIHHIVDISFRRYHIHLTDPILWYGSGEDDQAKGYDNPDCMRQEGVAFLQVVQRVSSLD
jgi:hypothetical protein